MFSVLIVDDERIIRSGMKNLIPWHSIGVTDIFDAASGEQALTIMEQYHPNLLITDINMKNMTGLELIEIVGQKYPETRSIVLTGYDDFEYARICLRLSVRDFLLKPVDEEQLLKLTVEIMAELEREELDNKQKKTKGRVQGASDQMKLEAAMRQLVSKRLSPDEIRELCEEFSIEANRPAQICVLTPSLSLSRQRSQEDFIKLSVVNICMELFDAAGTGVTFCDEEGGIVIAFSIAAGSDEPIEQIRRLDSIIGDEYDAGIKAVMGCVVDGFSQLHISYSEARCLMDDDSSSSKKEVLQTPDSSGRYKRFNAELAEIKREMVLNTGSRERVLALFDAFERSAEANNLADLYVRRCCFELASDLYFAYTLDSGESPDNRLNSLITSLAHSSKADCLVCTRDFLSKLISGGESSMHELVDKAKMIINEDLAGDISVASLAGMLFVTPNYFSRLFKKDTGEGCGEYIVRKRIEKAKSLLETTNIRSCQIASMVGYHDNNYFSLAFKKQTGVSPTAYREQTRKEAVAR